MQNIYLLRHGESEGNLNKAIYQELPDHAIPLTARGEAQAIAAGEALRDIINLPDGEPLRVWSSPYVRTRRTADLVEEQLRMKYPEVDRREHILLCEQQFGLFDGVPDEELPIRFPEEHAHYEKAARFEGRFWPRLPLGESRFDVAVRVHQSFGTFHRDADRHGVRNIVIVCHGVTMRAFIMQWLHLPFEWFEKERNPGNCDIYRISDDDIGIGEYVYQSPRT